MKNKGISIFLACAAGAFIGVLIGRWISISFISQLAGIAAGAGSAYLLYRPGEVFRAIRQVFVWEMDSKKLKLCMLHASMVMVFEIALMLLSVFGLVIGLIVCTDRPNSIGGHAHFNLGHYLYVQAGVVVAAMVITIVAFAVMMSEKSTFKIRRGIVREFGVRPKTFPYLRIEQLLIIFCNPVTLPVTIALVCLGVVLILCPFIMWQISVQTLKLIPGAVVWLWVGVKKVFVLIHSDIRTICLIDGGIGTAIGMCSHYNPIIGALVGGILGVANYYVVSIKILKLRPM